MLSTPLIPARVAGIELPPFDPLNARAAQLRAGGHYVISLGQALPFFGPPACAVEAAREALETQAVHGYSTDPGLLSLRSALAQQLSATAGTPVGPEDLVVTAGANHAFTLALTTLVGAEDEVILPAPYFTNQQMAVRAAGAVPVEAPVADRERFTIRWSDIEPHLTGRTRAVALCTPSNPTGATLDPREGALIAGELARRNIVLFSDETYMHFVYDGAHWSASSVPGWRQNVVIVGTFSKSFGMMGWRVGYMMADAAICEQAVKIQDAMIICAPMISQIAAERAVRERWTHAHSFHDELRRRRAVLTAGLARIPRLHAAPASAGLFAFTRVDGCADSARLSEELLERAHVVTIPGSAFGASGEGYLRLSYGYANVADLEEAVNRLERYFAQD